MFGHPPSRTSVPFFPFIFTTLPDDPFTGTGAHTSTSHCLATASTCRSTKLPKLWCTSEGYQLATCKIFSRALMPQRSKEVPKGGA